MDARLVAATPSLMVDSVLSPCQQYVVPYWSLDAPEGEAGD